MTKERVHAYAGWCGKALCYGERKTPDGTVSTTIHGAVTCTDCRALLDKGSAERWRSIFDKGAILP